jgi:hypothetical protein
MTTTTTNLTELEIAVLLNFEDSDYMDGDTYDEMVGQKVWSWSVTEEDKKMAGALGSLCKKGFCISTKCDDDYVTELTQQAADFLNSLKN